MTPLIFIYIVVYLTHLALGAGAGYAALRLWPSRRHPMVWRTIVYIHGFVIEAITSIVLLFVSRGTYFTQSFAAVLFTGMFLGDIVRVFLIAYLIKGPTNGALPVNTETAGDKDPDFWRRELRAILREELDRK
jgi:hypothetical protein